MSSANPDCVLGNTQLHRFDAIVVGSGAGGSAAAHVLTAAGLKVLVLEAGHNYFPGLDQVVPGGIPWPDFSNDEIKMSIRRLIWQDAVVEPRTFRQTDKNGETARPHPDVNVMTRNVGGAAVISTVSYPRFTAVDFRMKSALRDAGHDVPDDAGFADWPLTYDELEPYYYEAERLSGVAGADEGHPDADPFASSRKGKPFPLPPQPEMYVGRVLAEGARKLDYHPFNYPSAVNTMPYDGRPPCVSCGFCSGYGCPRNAKGSPAVTTLRRALMTGNCQLRYNAHVAQLLMNHTRTRVRGVKYFDPNGDLRSVNADHVFLCASPIESARLCFLSDPGGPGIGNSSGHLGRHLMFHFQTIAAGFFRQRLHGERGRSVTNGMADFRGVAMGGEALLGPDQPLGGVIEFSTSSEPIVAATDGLQALPVARALGLSFKDMLTENVFQAHIAVMIMQGEDAPQWKNRIDLDPTLRDIFGLPVPRITYQNHDFELDASDHYKPMMLDVMEAAGAEFGLIQPFDPAVPPVSRHILGGLRMGSDPRESVCDPSGRFHDVENLYCADAGVLVTGGGHNPAPTIIALGLRTAAKLVSAVAPERVLGTP